MANKKKKKTIKPNKLIVGFIIIFLCVLGVLNTGIAGHLVALVFQFFIGYFYVLGLLYIIFVTITYMLNRLYLIWRSKWAKAGSIALINIYLIYTSIYFYLIGVNSLSEYSSLSLDKTPGYIGYFVYLIVSKLLGISGMIILIVFLWVLCAYFIFFDKKIPHIDLSKYFKKKEKNKQKTFEDALEEKQSSVEEDESEFYTTTLIDTSKLTKFADDLKKDRDILSDLDDIKIEQRPQTFDEDIKSVKPNETIALGMFDDIFENNIVQEPEVKETLSYVEKSDFAFNEGPVINTPVEYDQNTNLETNEIVKKRSTKYKIPSIQVLNTYNQGEEIYKNLEKKAKYDAELLVNTLKSFSLNVNISNVVIGPSVTKYELQPEAGIKVSKFNSLANDIALALAASTIRIEAPIPGKAAVGIEVPNSDIMMVSLKEVLLAKTNDSKKKLQVGLGKDINGLPAFLEIDKTPHMLVAGSTGSGKSVCINSIIVSILLKSNPDEVKMVMIDPKKVELTPYDNIPHLLTPVVTDPKRASVILNKMVAEMEYRYELFAKTNTRNMAGFNEKLKTDKTLTYQKLPYIVIIVDELADLMMVASNEVETAIARLAQMARAAGIHLIIATQRPSTDVITGLIKANIPTRLSFAVSSSIDSRTILDSSGAEKLLGKGDMLLSTPNSPVLTRIQGAFLTDDEITKVVEQIRVQFDEDEIKDNHMPELDQQLIETESELEELDELYDQVRADVIEMQKASASYIQRKYKVGYNRAVRIIDQLEETNVIGANEGTKPRKVLITNDEDYFNEEQ